MLSLFRLHVFSQPRQCRALLFVPNQSGDTLLSRLIVFNPCMTIEPAPQGDTGTIVSFPHDGDVLLVIPFLVVIIRITDVILCNIHRNLQCILDLRHHGLETALTQSLEFMRLTAIGINRCTGIAQGADKFDKLVRVPLERVEVVINQDGIRPTLVRHLESLDNPVVACLAISSQGFTHQVTIGLMPVDSLVDHINHFQIRILFLNRIHPLLNSLVFLCCRESLQPFRILRSPDQTMELKWETFLLGIVIGGVCTTPVIRVTRALDGAPLGTILRSHLIPIVRIDESIIIHTTRPVGGDIS